MIRCETSNRYIHLVNSGAEAGVGQEDDPRYAKFADREHRREARSASRVDRLTYDPLRRLETGYYRAAAGLDYDAPTRAGAARVVDDDRDRLDDDCSPGADHRLRVSDRGADGTDTFRDANGDSVLGACAGRSALREQQRYDEHDAPDGATWNA